MTDNINAFVSSQTLNKHKSLLLILCASPKSTPAVPTQTERQRGERELQRFLVSLERPRDPRERCSPGDTAALQGAHLTRDGMMGTCGLFKPGEARAGVLEEGHGWDIRVP